MRKWWAVLIALACSGCSGDLLVDFKKADNRMPVRRTAAFANFKFSQAWNSATNTCDQTRAIEIVYLPVGEEYYVGFEGAELAETKFSLELYESGAAKRVSLDSNPQIDETLSATATLVRELSSAASSLLVPKAAATKAPPGTCPPVASSVLAPLACLLAETEEAEKKKLHCPGFANAEDTDRPLEDADPQGPS